MLNKLSSTSALVLLWAEGHNHKNRLSSKYFRLINLSPAKELYLKCNQVWPFYSEVIKNRKKCVLDLVQMGISNDKIKQIIILGSGWDSLSLEILSYNKSVKIFEIDFSLNEKRIIIEKIDKSLFESLFLISNNLKNSKSILHSLKKSGWSQKMPTLVVFEGISYYLSEQELKNILRIFKSKNKSNRIILEYLVSQDLISKRRALIPDEIFGIIKNEIKLQNITRYNQNSLKKIIEDLGGCFLRRFTMKELESLRTGMNIHFKRVKSGWIEVSYLSL